MPAIFTFTLFISLIFGSWRELEASTQQLSRNLANFAAPPPPSHQMRGSSVSGQNRSSSSVANSTSPSTSSSSSSNNGSPIKEIPSIGSTCNNRVSHSVSVPLNLFNVMHKQAADLNNPVSGSTTTASANNTTSVSGDHQGTLPNSKSDMDAAR